MDKEVHGLRLAEGLKGVSTQLESLQSMICTVCMGLENDKIEKQAVDVVVCIGLCIGNIKSFADGVLEISGAAEKDKDIPEKSVADNAGG